MIVATRAAVLVAAVWLTTAAVPALAQQKLSKPDTIDQFILRELAERAAADAVETIPREAPRAKQLTAPSAAGGADPVDAPSFTELIAVAFDNQFLKREDDVFTIDLNLFAFRALVDQSVIDEQPRYGTRVNDILRRFGGSVSFGGKGEAFDADGDGKAESAKKAEEATDIVTWEFRYRLFGSRDRRDDENLRRYVAATEATSDELQAEIANLVASFADGIGQLAPAGTPLTADSFARVKALPGFEAALDALVPRYAAAIKPDAEAIEAIDKRAIWTVVGGGTQRKAQFGPNKWRVGLRGVLNSGRLDHTFNADFSRIDAFLGKDAADTFKAGYEASAQVLKGRTFGEDGAKLSLSAGFEKYRNVPDVKHETIAQASARIDFPIAEGITLPMSVAYANHKDLLTEGGQVIGNVALAIDFSGLNKKKAEKSAAGATPPAK